MNEDPIQSYRAERQASELNLERMKERLRRTSTTSFWLQAVIGVVAGVSWLLAPVLRLSTSQGLPVGSNAGSAIAFWVTLGMIVSLGVNVYFTRQNLLGSQIQGITSREDLTVRLRLVVLISLVGAFLSVISSSAQVGELFSRALLYQNYSIRLVISELLVVVINSSVALAHLISLACSLWISGILDRR